MWFELSEKLRKVSTKFANNLNLLLPYILWSSFMVVVVVKPLKSFLSNKFLCTNFSVLVSKILEIDCLPKFSMRSCATVYNNYCRLTEVHCGTQLKTLHAQTVKCTIQYILQYFWYCLRSSLYQSLWLGVRYLLVASNRLINYIGMSS